MKHFSVLLLTMLLSACSSKTTEVPGHLKHVDQVIWIVDDMIDTAGSVYALVRELNKRGVAEVSIAAVHPVFSPPAVSRLTKLYQEGLLANVVVTDTIGCAESLKGEMPFLHVVSSARMSAGIIMRMNEEGSLSPFFEPFNAQEYLSSMKLFI